MCETIAESTSCARNTLVNLYPLPYTRYPLSPIPAPIIARRRNFVKPPYGQALVKGKARGLPCSPLRAGVGVGG